MGESANQLEYQPGRLGNSQNAARGHYRARRALNKRIAQYLHALVAPPSLLRKVDSVDAAIERHQLRGRRILNVGSKNVRLGDACVNLDIAPGPGVDVVGDAHDLGAHFAPESFDGVVLSAVL